MAHIEKANYMYITYLLDAYRMSKNGCVAYFRKGPRTTGASPLMAYAQNTYIPFDLI